MKIIKAMDTFTTKFDNQISRVANYAHLKFGRIPSIIVLSAYALSVYIEVENINTVGIIPTITLAITAGYAVGMALLLVCKIDGEQVN